MTRRIVRLLTEEPAIRVSQRKYRQQPQARAAQADHWATWYAKPENRAKAIARATKWQQDNRTQRRVYNRIWSATRRRLAREQATAA